MSKENSIYINLVAILYKNLTTDIFLFVFLTQNIMKWQWKKRIPTFKSIQIKTIEMHNVLWVEKYWWKATQWIKALLQCAYLQTHNLPLGKKIRTGSNDQKNPICRRLTLYKNSGGLILQNNRRKYMLSSINW